MPSLIHTFDTDGYYESTSEAPVHPFTGEAAQVNPEVATADNPPVFDAATERLRRVNGAWVLEHLPPPPDTAPLPEPEPVLPQYPRFYGNDKFDLFKPEHRAVAAAAMVDPDVKVAYDRMMNALHLTYEDPEMEQGLSLLVSKGLLTEARKSEIVAEMQPR